MEEKKERMKELAGLLNQAARTYYQEAREIMSNFEYDRLYDELEAGTGDGRYPFRKSYPPGGV